MGLLILVVNFNFCARENWVGSELESNLFSIKNLCKLGKFIILESLLGFLMRNQGAKINTGIGINNLMRNLLFYNQVIYLIWDSGEIPEFL
jgi:hypothetical protein